MIAEYLNYFGIPWQKFKEEEIHAIIGIYFQNKGYTIDYLHKADRSKENGADIVCKKGKKNIAIAVKIKPNKKDLPQYLELSNRTENKKIYVYIETPTADFSKFISNEKRNVIIWDRKSLDKEFIDNNLEFCAKLIFLKHDFFDNITFIQNIFGKLWYEAKFNLNHNKYDFNYDTLKYLWRLKDDSVTLHKVNDLTTLIFEQPIINKNKLLDKHYLTIYLNYLNLINKSYKNYCQILSEFISLNKYLVLNSIHKNKDRSQWVILWDFKSKWDKKDVLKYNLIISKINSSDNDYERLSKENDVWSAISKINKILLSLGLALEEIVDNIFKEYMDNLKKIK